MAIVETVFYFIVTLGVLVFVHEFGHFLAAKLCGMRVDVFSIGFPPRAFGKKIGDTDYCISWIPIGGYVTIAGMIDESFDTDFVDQPPQPWEYRAKPIWQRMIVISAGVIMNALLAVVLYWGITYSQGKTTWQTTEIGYVAEDSPAAKAGLRPGDRVLSINGTDVTHWEMIRSLVYLEHMGDDIVFLVEREGAKRELALARDLIPDLDTREASFGIVPIHTEIVITALTAGKPADELGLKPLDVIIALNGTPVRYDGKVSELVRASAGRPLHIEWRRGDTLMSGTTIPTDEGLIGTSFGARYTGPVTKEMYTFFGALPKGIEDIITITRLSFRQLKLIITGRSAFTESVAGPVRIAQMAMQTAERGLITYLGFMALLSISLAILNMLPIPALDGGHLLFLIYEMVFRREIPVKIKLGLQRAGFILLLAFMAFVVYNDIMKF